MANNDFTEGCKNEEKAISLWVELSQIVHYTYCIRDTRAGARFLEEA